MTIHAATAGPIGVRGAVSDATNENALMPAAISLVGTKAAIASAGMTRWDSTLKPPTRRAKKPIHAAFMRM